MTFSRRGFLAATAATTLACRRKTRDSAASPMPAAGGPLLLFQGDSITDSGRDTNADENSSSSLGLGYVLLIAADLLKLRTDSDIQFANRGISGNKSVDLLKRWSADTLSVRPAIVSILVGVNDYAHRRGGFYHGTVNDFERNYGQLLNITRQALPSAKIVVIEPFLLQAGRVDNSWLSGFAPYRDAARRSASVANATFVEMQEKFNELARQRKAEYWSRDGIHPTLAGHAIIAERWRAAVGL